MVLLITRLLPPAIMEQAKREFVVRTLNLEGRFEPSEVFKNVSGVDSILCTPADIFDEVTIRRLPRTVRVIATYSVGLDHIDLAAADVCGIKICHTPDVLSVATAELALTLMLMAARRTGEGERIIRSGNWTGISPTFHLGTGVVGKTLGILGMGRIGRKLAKMARGLGMSVHYHNRSRLPPDLEAEAVYHSSDQSFLSVCDFLSMNVPADRSTIDWLDARRIEMLKSGAIIVNTGRGSTIDDEALIAALISGKVAAAGLDVYGNEPSIHPGYLKLENVVLLPHIGSATVEARHAMGLLALNGIREALQRFRDDQHS